MTNEEVVTAVEERDVRFIRLWLSDILGQLKSFSITRGEVASALEHGMGFDVRLPGGEPYEGDPRHVLRRALDRAGAMGFDHFYLSPELEYFYFRGSEAPEVLDRGGYFGLTTLDAACDLRRDTVMALEEVGIAIEYSHHEVGPPSTRSTCATTTHCVWPTTS